MTEEGADIWALPKNINQLKTAIIDFINETGCKKIEGIPEYTAFSSLSKIVLSEVSQNPFTVLQGIGQEMIRYRSYGRNKNGSHVLPWGNEEAKQLFSKDHDLLLSLDKGVELDKHPERVIFGLPHNYFFQTTGLEVGITGETYKRRASPLFIHVHQLAKEYVAVLTYLPAKFLPDGETIEVVDKKTDKSKGTAPCNVNGRVITDFLKDIPNVMEVL